MTRGRAGAMLGSDGAPVDYVEQLLGVRQTIKRDYSKIPADVRAVLEAYAAGLVLILVSRLCDGLDGAVARQTGKTDLGGYLDIVLDFAFYGLVPLAFVVARPENGLAGAVLIFSFYANGASFLAFAIMAEKRGIETEARGPKSLHFTTGLAEATETIFVFCLFCLWPSAFPPIAFGFAALCLLTAMSRIALAMRTFG